MYGTLQRGGTAAIEDADREVIEFAVRPDSENPEWLYDAAQSILGSDAGLQLSFLTGYPERSCYRYIAHDLAKRRRPPEHFIRALIRSPQGEPFHAAFMAGCTAEWWLEHEAARDLCRQYRIMKR